MERVPGRTELNKRAVLVTDQEPYREVWALALHLIRRQECGFSCRIWNRAKLMYYPRWKLKVA